jgi:O-methyltransferase
MLMNVIRARARASLDDSLYGYLQAHQPPEHPELSKLRDITRTMPRARMQISIEQGHFLAFLVRLIGARRTLEIGTFTGYSALAVALALPPDGRVLGCDISEEWVSIGRPFWFVDADKENLDGYYETSLRLVRPGGLIILDNMFQGGRVIDSGNTEFRTGVVRDLNAKIAADDRVDRVLIPVGDGMTLVRRRS